MEVERKGKDKGEEERERENWLGGEKDRARSWKNLSMKCSCPFSSSFIGSRGLASHRIVSSSLLASEARILLLGLSWGEGWRQRRHRAERAVH